MNMTDFLAEATYLLIQACFYWGLIALLNAAIFWLKSQKNRERKTALIWSASGAVVNFFCVMLYMPYLFIPEFFGKLDISISIQMLTAIYLLIVLTFSTSVIFGRAMGIYAHQGARRFSIN